MVRTGDDIRDGRELVKMSELSRRSGVPGPTIKHYMREGLLPPPAKRTSPNMAYYDAALVPRIRRIKTLQRTQFLPLKVIKRLLDEPAPTSAQKDTMVRAIASVLADEAGPSSVTRRELLADGVPGEDLDYLLGIGLLEPSGEGDDAVFSGDDLEIIRTISGARRAGLTEEMLPTSILLTYYEALRALVQVEVGLFRDGVLPQAGEGLSALAEEATRLSERLVVHIRRKQLIPAMERLVEDEIASRQG